MRTYKLFRSIMVLTLVITLGALFSVSGIWILDEYHKFKLQAEESKQRYVEQKKEYLKREVEHVIEYINDQRTGTEGRTAKAVREHVIEACRTAEHLYKTFSGKVETKLLHSIVRESLREFRFFNGRGYYFAIDPSGLEMLFADQPRFEGQNLLNLRNSAGQYVIRDMLKIAETSGEGFYEYNWTKPGAEGDMHKKIAYIRYVPGLNWVIGSGEYPEDVENDIKNEILNYLSTIRIEEAGYIFGGTYQGVSILGPVVGQNMYNIQDANGVKIVQELIAKAKNGGGFVKYVMPKFENTRPLPKISYTEAIPEWGWYFGFGIYIDEIDQQLAIQKNQMKKVILNKVGEIGLIFLLVFMILFIVFRIISGQSRKDFKVFFQFFENSVFENKKIQLDKLRIEEFADIAKLTNSMVDKKKVIEDQLQSSLDERSILLREIHHRVKNNFQAMVSLFSLQIANTKNKQARVFLEDARNRIFSMSAVHTLLYDNENLTNINFRNYLELIFENAFISHDMETGRIQRDIDIDDIFFSLEEAVPVGLVINELVTNSCKYAFPGDREGIIRVSVTLQNGTINIIYSDDGVGLPKNVSLTKNSGFGFQVINLLLSQISGKIECGKDVGFSCKIEFPYHARKQTSVQNQ